ncbi:MULTISPECIES: mannitol dehydrogenase family protein [unclassified Microbacterium]|uniref:mannitol dehydrogenase family protein n=1 Tax=unclassified Microbacterium TaxID=2609290 RepID=UPI00214AB2C9|nr:MULTISPECIES: mannitol dehydrogenase family protein [unclassified Microbacterium]MCR2785082.1 mannitol dehydrogenase family protein [Microbacterium sp. zg.B96]WIM16615.1 mannitol dehydrogenase family protein [Microbacterium sp. zg-B96]
MTGATFAARSERERPPVRIVHIGLGRFFRAHQAWYTARATDAGSWGIAAFTVRSPRAAAELAADDCVYTLTVRGPEADTQERIDSVVAAHDGSDIDALRHYVSRPEVAVITLTVTEGGYGLTANGEPDLSDPEVSGDLEGIRAGASSAQSVLGRLIVALDARRRAGAGPIALVPCDNVPGNGSFLARGLVGFAEHTSSDLAAWIRGNVSFVSTSVDRITPQTPGGEVVTEPFSDWVLAGDFPAGRPAWESAGARFVDDIEPWENRKLWLLNGAHSILAFAGLPRGAETVAEAMADPTCRALVDEFWDEAVQCLPAGTEHGNYRHQLAARFRNPRIVHRLSQIAADATTKAQFRFAAVAERTLDAGGSPDASARAVAEWIGWVITKPSESDARADEVSAAVASTDPVARLVGVISPRLAASADFIDRVRSGAVPNVSSRRRPAS